MGGEKGSTIEIVQQSLDDLRSAALIYPYRYRFRIGQAEQLYKLAKASPALAVPAEQAIKYALVADPNEAQLLIGLLVIERRLGQCNEVGKVEARLVALVPQSLAVRRFSEIYCHPGGEDGR